MTQVEYGPRIHLSAARRLHPLKGRRIIAITSDHYWGEGATGASAISKARSMGAANGARVYLYEVPQRTTISSMGAFTYRPPEGMTWDEVDKAAYCRATPLGNAIL